MAVQTPATMCTGGCVDVTFEFTGTPPFQFWRKLGSVRGPGPLVRVALRYGGSKVGLSHQVYPSGKVRLLAAGGAALIHLACHAQFRGDNPSFSAYTLRCFKGKDGAAPGILPFAPAKGLGKSPYRYRERRLMGGQRLDLRRLQDIIRQFVLHHDGCASSADCFHVLHDERGLSAHFLVDNNGWIYQTLDLADGAFHASGVNEISIGVELCNRGQIELDGPDFYRKRGLSRDVAEMVVHNTRYRMWQYAPDQYMAMAALGKALARLLPNLPQVFPEWNGQILNTWMADPRAFAGYIGHYHVTNNKWDPGCFDFRWLAQKIRVSSTWFVCLDKNNECPKPPEIAENPQVAEQQGQTLYRNNEEEAMGGYFPVGPFGRSRLWHGGIHLNLPQSSSVFTPFPGRIVAARFGDDVPTGSSNFVLMRHYFRLAGVETLFFILYMHLEREEPKSGRTPWLAEAEKKPFWSAMSAGGVFYPDILNAAANGHIICFGTTRSKKYFRRRCIQ